MPSMTQVRHATFCVNPIDEDGGHEGGEACYGGLVEIAPDVPVFLSGEPGDVVLRGIGRVEMTPGQVGAAIAKLVALRAEMGA